MIEVKIKGFLIKNKIFYVTFKKNNGLRSY